MSMYSSVFRHWALNVVCLTVLLALVACGASAPDAPEAESGSQPATQPAT